MLNPMPVLSLILLLPVVLRAGQSLEFEEHRISESSRKPNYRIDLRYPHLRSCPANPDAAQAFNVAVKSIVQKRLAHYRAKQLPPEDSPHGGSLALRSTVTTRRDGVVSVLFDWDCYIAVHSNQELASLVFDTSSAEPSELSSLFRPNVDFVAVLSRIAIADLIRRKERQHIDTKGEARKWIERGAGPLLRNFNVFTLTDKTLVLHFVTYQVGSYVEHAWEVRIPWERLKPELAMRWRDGLD